MTTINPTDTLRAARNRQVSGRPHVRLAQQTEGLSPMMTQGLASITFSEADRARVVDVTDSMYRAALRILQDANAAVSEILQDANELRATAGLRPLPEGVVDLNARRVPRQAVPQ